MRKSLTKQERLRTRAEIQKVFQAGRTASCNGMRLSAVRNRLDVSRIVVIPAKGHKNAVERNRSRRLGKEAFRLLKHRVSTGFDIAIVCYPGDFHYVDRHDQMVQLLTRLRLLSNEPA